MGVEIAHHHYRVAMAAAGVKRAKLPPALRIPRPDPWRPPPPPTSRTHRPPHRSGRRHATTVSEVVAALSCIKRR